MRRLLGFVTLACMLSLPAHAQDFPTKAVTIIVPSSPGGISDTGARIVAEGLSNPQIGERLFVSRRTVQTHLGHVFNKLQMSSRSELAAAVTRRGDQGRT